MGLSIEQSKRFSRHLLLEQVGEAGQLKLQQAKVMIIGLGGLGNPAALYLAAAGVGELHLVDGDSVEVSNLQRQILFREQDVDELKVDAAQRNLEDINSRIELIPHATAVNDENIDALLQQVDVVLDCTDNFRSRRLINKACRAAGIPLVSGAAIRFEGQLALFDFRQPNSPCYQCLYPEGRKEPQLNCANSGVLGPILGVIASMQALTAIKLIVGLPAQAGQLQLFDGLTMRWQSFQIKPAAECCRAADEASS